MDAASLTGATDALAAAHTVTTVNPPITSRRRYTLVIKRAVLCSRLDYKTLDAISSAIYLYKVSAQHEQAS